MMNSNRLMREFEELEGLGKEVTDDTPIIYDDKDDDDMVKRQNAASLLASDVYYELEKRGKKTTGFPDTDRELLQAEFDAEYTIEKEKEKVRREEKAKKAAAQLGLQRRRMLMEKTLQEEQDELARNHQVALMINLIKENMVDPAIRMEVNSISARTLAKAMWVNNTVTCVDLSSNEINDHAGSYIARILKKNNTIRKLELDNNNLGSKSCQAFGESLMTNSALTYLSLDSNPLCTNGDINGIKAIAEAIRVNTTLISLNLWRTQISAVGGGILADGIEQNDTILFCDVAHNDIDITDIKRITNKLDANLAAFEARERVRRDKEMTEEQRKSKTREQIENEKKQRELAQWLKERREQRSEDKRIAEEQRIQHMMEEMEEKERLIKLRKEADKKAADEAAAKKAKKKDKKGKKK